MMHAGVIAASIPAAALILWLYGDQLLGPIPDYSKVLSTVSEYKVTDWDLMAKSGAPLLLLLLLLHLLLLLLHAFIKHPRRCRSQFSCSAFVYTICW
jgi:hypothetical protein